MTCVGVVLLALAAPLVKGAAPVQAPVPQAPQASTPGAAPAEPVQPGTDKDGLPDPIHDTSLVLFPGGIIWQTALAAPPAFAPAFDGDAAFVILEDGSLVAISTMTGAVAWSVSASAVHPPAAGHGLVAGVGHGEVWARDAASGGPRWQAAAEGSAALSPLVTSAGVIVATEQGGLTCYGLTDGTVAWRAALGGSPTVLAAGAGDGLLAGFADGRVVAVTVAGGRVVWTRALRGRILTLTAIDRRVYAGSDDNFLYVLDARKGGFEWKWRTGGDLTGTVAVTDRRLSYASMDSMLRAHNRGNGHLVWKRGLPSRPVGGPVMLHDRLVLADVAFDLRSYRLSDGSPLDSFTLDDRLIHPPRLAPEAPGLPARLVVLTAGGLFTALGRGVDGAVVAMTDLPGVEILAERPIDWIMDPPLDPVLRILAALIPQDVLFPLDARYSDPPLRPLATIPGVRVPPEVLLPLRLRITDPPIVPLTVLPGRSVPPETLPGVPRRAAH